MNQPMRLAEGGRVDRSRSLSFSFNATRCQGHPGDTLASALLANGVSLVGRSIKLHRPRGIVGAGAEEPNAILQVGEGADTLADQRATQVELYEGLAARAVNGWPSLSTDLMAALGWFGRLMPVGFYYKTFMWPRRAWPFYEKLIRQAAGSGMAPETADPDVYDRVNAHCDVLVIGAGPAGLAAALAAGRAGARVIVADEQAEPGGWLLSSRASIDGRPAMDWVAATLAELAGMPEVTLLPRCTVFGAYDHGFYGLLERCTDHLGPGAAGPRQRYHRVRAARAVLASGALERPVAFGNNDRPGVMLASAVTSYLQRYAVAPGRRAVVFTNNDSAYAAASALLDAGVELAAVVDAREAPSPAAEALRARGVEWIGGSAVVDAAGRRRVDGVTVAGLAGATERRIDCDLLAVSGGWNPVLHLHAHSGVRPAYDRAIASFVPGPGRPEMHPAGACRGSFGIAAALADGFAAGTAAAGHASHRTEVSPAPAVTGEEPAPGELRVLWRSPPPRRGHAKAFVDLQNDVGAGDVELAVREGYRSIELVKRYSILGFGTDQGRLGNIIGAGIAAEALGEDLGAIGTSTFRPPYTPVTYGALVGPDLRDLFEPVRTTPMHAWHEAHGARFEDVGQWKRAWYYPRQGESMEEAVRRECLATHQGVGVLDYSTLGKIDIQGPDAAELLDRVYTNGWRKLAVGRCRYGLMLDENGMVFDDGVTVRLGEQHYLMHTTTGGAARVLSWLERWLQTEWPDLDVYLTSVTDQWATVSLAGPRSRQLLGELCPDVDLSAENFRFFSMQQGTVAGVAARILRVSFSGELCFEVSVPADYGLYLWEAVIAAGEKHGATPYGTETMHVLRAEKGFIIVGQDTDGSVTPMDLGMGGMVSAHKDCLGKRSLSRPDLTRADRKQLVGLLPEDPERVIPEGAQLVRDPDHPVPLPMEGHVTSSYYGARLGRSFALAMVKGGRERMEERLFAWTPETGPLAARITSTVFFDPEGERQNV